MNTTTTTNTFLEYGNHSEFFADCRKGNYDTICRRLDMDLFRWHFSKNEILTAHKICLEKGTRASDQISILIFSRYMLYLHSNGQFRDSHRALFTRREFLNATLHNPYLFFKFFNPKVLHLTGTKRISDMITKEKEYLLHVFLIAHAVGIDVNVVAHIASYQSHYFTRTQILVFVTEMSKRRPPLAQEELQKKRAREIADCYCTLCKCASCRKIKIQEPTRVKGDCVKCRCASCRWIKKTKTEHFFPTNLSA